MKEYSKGIYVKFKPEEVEMHVEQTKLLKKRLSQSFIFMMQIQRRVINYFEKATAWLCGLPAVQGDWGILHNKQKCAGYISVHCLPICEIA